jgi:hypothetical protein
MDRRRLLAVVVTVLVAVGAFALARGKRPMQDYEVYHTVGLRARAAEPLYRESDGHYQFKYLPAFALAVAPLSFLPVETGKFVWFMITVGFLVVALRGSIHALPDRRRSVRLLTWLTLLLIGKFVVRELVHGQSNVILVALVVLALLAASRGRVAAAGVLVAVAVFVKPYAILLMPWLAIAYGTRAVVPATIVLAGGLLVPALVYGWRANLDLIVAWYDTVTTTTPENLLYPENISFAAMWQRWLGPGPVTYGLATATGVASLILAASTWLRRRSVRAPEYLEAGLLLLLMPLLSPQGWDYVLVMGTPAIVLLLDRWHDLPGAAKAAVVAGFAVTSFAIFDLMGRTMYLTVVERSVPALGATALIIVVASLRWRGQA